MHSVLPAPTRRLRPPHQPDLAPSSGLGPLELLPTDSEVGRITRDLIELERVATAARWRETAPPRPSRRLRASEGLTAAERVLIAGILVTILLLVGGLSLLLG